MSWYAAGDEEIVGGLERGSQTWRFKVRLGETVTVQFVDDEFIELPHPENAKKTLRIKSPFQFKEHQYRTVDRFENFITCVAPALGLEGCAGCSMQDVPRRRVAWTVIVSGHKKKDGSPLPTQQQLLVTDVNSTAHQSIMKRAAKLAEQGQSLRGAVFEVSRLGKQAQSACAQGTQYDFEGIEDVPPEAEVFNYFEEFKPPASKRDAEVMLGARITGDGPQRGGRRDETPRPSRSTPRDRSTDDDDVVDYD
jgi:hypothetical protein